MSVRQFHLCLLIPKILLAHQTSYLVDMCSACECIAPGNLQISGKYLEIIRSFGKEEEFFYTAVQGYQWMNYSIKQNISVGQGFAFNLMVCRILQRETSVGYGNSKY